MGKMFVIKSLLLTLLFALLCNVTFSQQRDVVYLKNGSVLKGKIIEFIPNQKIKIETSDGSVFVCKSSEVLKIEKESAGKQATTNSGKSLRLLSDEQYDNANPSDNNTRIHSLKRYQNVPGNNNVNIDEYNTNSTIGLAIGGGGIIGATYRYFPMKHFGMELGAFLRPLYYQTEMYYYDDTYSGNAYDSNTEYTFTRTVMFAAGPVVYLGEKVNYKGKIKKNGISVKAGISPLGDVNEIMGTLNWLHDTYKQKNKNRYFSFELGLGAMYMYKVPYEFMSGYLGMNSDITPAIYWKLNWFWSL